MLSGSRGSSSEQRVSRTARTECYKVRAIYVSSAFNSIRSCVPGAYSDLAAMGSSCALSIASSALLYAPCPQARDAFYACVRECGQLHTVGAPVPPNCRSLRAKFEGACLPSWVRRSRCVRLPLLFFAPPWRSPLNAADRNMEKFSPCNGNASKMTQVRHFDELQTQRAREARSLHEAINARAHSAAGNLAGAAQQ